MQVLHVLTIGGIIKQLAFYLRLLSRLNLDQKLPQNKNTFVSNRVFEA